MTPFTLANRDIALPGVSRLSSSAKRRGCTMPETFVYMRVSAS